MLLGCVWTFHMGAFQSYEALRSEYPQCPVCVTPWSQNVPPNWSEALLVANQFSEKSEGVYFVISNLYNGLNGQNATFKKYAPFSCTKSGQSNSYLHICFYTWKFRMAFNVLKWNHYCFLRWKKTAGKCKMFALNLQIHNITCVVSGKSTCGIVTNPSHE